jgi:hypothetical protein
MLNAVLDQNWGRNGMNADLTALMRAATNSNW